MIGAVRRLLRACQPLVPRAAGGISILAYHLVDGGTDLPVDLPGGMFEQQMGELAARRCVRSLDEALAVLAAGGAAEERLVVLTFDDGHRNFLRRVWPVLERYRLPCTLYVPTGFVDGSAGPPLSGAERLPPLSWAELEKLAAEELVTVGSHGHSHRELTRLTHPEAARELELSQTLLRRRLGVAADHLCYPRAARGRAVEELARRFYRSAAAAGGRVNRRGYDPHRLSRLPLRRDMPVSLETVLSASVWLEERVASRVRRWRHPRRKKDAAGTA